MQDSLLEIANDKVELFTEMLNLQEEFYKRLYNKEILNEEFSFNDVWEFIKKIIFKTKDIIVKVYYAITDYIRKQTGIQLTLGDGILFSEERFNNSKILETYFISAVSKSRVLIADLRSMLESMIHNDLESAHTVRGKIFEDTSDLEKSFFELKKVYDSSQNRDYKYVNTIKTQAFRNEVNKRNENINKMYGDMLKEFTNIENLSRKIKNVEGDTNINDVKVSVTQTSKLILSMSEYAYRVLSFLNGSIMAGPNTTKL